MIGRVVLAVLLAGIAAGLVMGVIQHFKVTPLIVAAESYELPALAAEAGGHSHEAGWTPAQGFERSFYTMVSTMMAGAAWAAALAGISLLSGAAITRRSGLVWGLAGFVAASLAPAAGLPPELPGMPAADLGARQLWWTATILATAGGLWLIAFRHEWWAKAVAVILIALPHVIGAPRPATLDSAVPAPLAATFVATTLAANAVFWVLIGLFLGLALDRFAKEMFRP